MEEDIYQTEAPVSTTWQQYYPSPQDVPYGFQFNENQAMANALRKYNQDPYLTPVTYMPGYEDTLTRKLLEKNNANLTTTQPRQSGGGMQMPNMNMDLLKNLKLNQGSNTQEITSPGTGTTEYAPFGGDTAATEYAPWGGDTAVTEYAPWGGDTAPATEYAPWGGDTAASTGGNNGLFGNGGDLGGGWASAFGGALAGYNQGAQNYRDDPNMWSGKDGYGKYHKDYRAEVGGGILGGVMGYYGGPVGAALAGPAVKFVHPYAEKGTRAVINAGDKVGGSGGALMVDPIGTVSSGKYSWGDLGKGALLGPAKKWFGW